MKILILDNYDSFTYNLVHLVQSHTDGFDVKRNDEISLSAVAQYDKIILSPGPGLPKDAGIMQALIDKYKSSKSILGICLGMQGIAEVFGAKLTTLDTVLHGMQNLCKLKDTPLFRGLPSSIRIGHYHSWVVDKVGFPDQLSITAKDENGLIMGIVHKTFDIQGVQFHPESVLTPQGDQILKNWINQ